MGNYPKICHHCGELSMHPYTIFEEGNFFIEHCVCTKCYNRVEFVYYRNLQEYTGDKDGIKKFGQN